MPEKAPLKLWIGGEIQAEIADGYRLSRNEIQKDINDFIANKEYLFPADCWDCIAVIRNDDVFEERVRFSPKRMDMDFRLRVDYQKFLAATHEGKIRLLYAMLVRSLQILKEKVKTPNTIDTLLVDLETLAKSKKWV